MLLLCRATVAIGPKPMKVLMLGLEPQTGLSAVHLGLAWPIERQTHPQNWEAKWSHTAAPTSKYTGGLMCREFKTTHLIPLILRRSQVQFQGSSVSKEITMLWKEQTVNKKRHKRKNLTVSIIEAAFISSQNRSTDYSNAAHYLSSGRQHSASVTPQQLALERRRQKEMHIKAEVNISGHPRVQHTVSHPLTSAHCTNMTSLCQRMLCLSTCIC